MTNRGKLIFLITILFLTSCATGPDFEAGRLRSREFAKQDAFGFDCSQFPRKVYPGMEARKYTMMLRSDGKTESYIEGFYLGYQRYYIDYIKVYCK